jgi:hypothetical protein
VEAFTWAKDCIEEGLVEFSSDKPKKKLVGRRPGAV